MCCSCAMMSSSVTSPIAKEGVDVDGAERDGAEREGGAVESNCLDRNCALLHFMIAASMAHMKVKWSDKGKGTKKWHKILVIVEGKMSLLQGAESK